MQYCDLNTEIEVGASAHYVQIGPFRGLIDCGMHPKYYGYKALPDLAQIADDTLDFICITHAHLDHCAALPIIARKHPHATIMTNRGGADLVVRMLRNSKAVMAKQKDELKIMEYPLYSSADIDAVKSRIIPMQNGVERTLELSSGEKITISFWGAGHIPGAASVLLEYNRRRILFSGDMSFHSTALLKGANPPSGKVDTLVVETTRGSYDRPKDSTYQSEVQRFLKSLSTTIKDGGSVLVPAFALGRMQEVLLIIQKAKAEGTIPKDTPVFATGLGVDIAEQMIELSKKSHHFSFAKQAMEGVKPMRFEIKPGQDFEEKGIYVLGSGMLVEHTPSFLAASAMMAQKENSICFVGYCDPDTPAGKLLQCKPGDYFNFEGLFYSTKINCKVDKFDLSSHADRADILKFIIEKDPRCVILTHGSETSREWFMDNIIDISPKTQVIIPQPSEYIEV